MASAAPAPDSSPDATAHRRPRAQARRLRDAAGGALRPSGILEAPVIEVVADPDADPDELVGRVRELQARGARVSIVERDQPGAVVASDAENPLTGHDEILSATVVDDTVELVISKDHRLEDGDSEILNAIGVQLASKHGRTGQVNIVVRRAKE